MKLIGIKQIFLANSLSNVTMVDNLHSNLLK